ncbi:bifunctional diguanylate cyclase/phosphodiesterase [Ureibacillus aquaedulcis]|uniref:EAL domain-containing protein n=1 Tax=Ureibacillus aquaedulcis TaxID=3058421 RepID=A0ABT8GUJ1_9BACL|nr:EAL domain-containing protein [Ureibacillus sp. BA0131]MDN4495077.1 EAL domain-containing protein [Ureibacillus sp. BA0131]
MRRRGIRFWALISITAVSFITTVLFVFLSYTRISKSLKDQYINESESVLEQSSNNFTVQFSNVQTILASVSEELEKDFVDVFNTLQFYERLTPSNSPIYLGLENGQYYLSSKQLLPDSYKVVEQEWYQNTGNGNEVSWTEPYLDYLTQELVISASIPVKHNGHNGIAAIQFSIDDISSIISQSVIGEKGLVMLISSSGKILANRDNYLISESIIANNQEALLERSFDEQVPYVIDGQNYLIHTMTIDQNGMSILTAINEKELQNYLIKSLYPIVLTGIVTLLLFSSMAYLVLLRGIKPLKNLGTLMSYVELGNYDVYAKEKKYLEVYQLSKGFNSMIRAIKKRDRELNLTYNELKKTEGQLRSKYEQLKASEEKILHLASYDPLTGVLNRRSLMQLLEESIEHHNGESLKGIIFLDLDNFKTVNDSLGHTMGDKLIIEVANRLSSITAGNKNVARISGDEFIIIIHDLQSENEIEAFAKEIVQTFDEPLIVDAKQLNVTASMGVALFPIHADSTEELIKFADMAMYQVKGLGKNGYKIFDEDIKKAVDEKVEIELGIGECLKENNFELVFQPLFNVQQGRITNVEALLRSKSSALSKFNIFQIIQTAEITGQIIEIDKWVLREACLSIQKINKEVEVPLHISVNVSALHIMQQDFVSNVKEIIEETGVKPEWIDLEITETSLMESFDQNINKLYELKEKGISLHLDDFGTGYSSLNYLNSLPIDHVKIDKSFIDKMLESKKDSKIVETIIALSHNIGLKVVAEGVEYKEQFELLTDYQCELMQGYFISKPANYETIIERVNNNLKEKIISV